MTFCRLLFFKYDHLSDQLFSRYNCFRYGYSRYNCQMWCSCSPDITVLQIWLFSRRSCQLFSSSYSPVAVLQKQLPSTQLFSRCGCPLDVAVLQTWLPSRRSYSPDVAALQTQLFSRRGCSPDVAVSCSPVAVLQKWLPSMWLFSRCSCSLDIVLLFGAAKRTSYFRLIGYLIILQTQLFSRCD